MLPSLTWSQLLSPVSIISSLLLPAVCMTGDHLLSTKFIRSNMYRRALTDSVTHGIIGGVSWMVVLGESALSRSGVTQFFLGFILASVVDVDHFIMARSLKLQVTINMITALFNFISSFHYKVMNYRMLSITEQSVFSF